MCVRYCRTGEILVGALGQVLAEDHDGNTGGPRFFAPAKMIQYLIVVRGVCEDISATSGTTCFRRAPPRALDGVIRADMHAAVRVDFVLTGSRETFFGSVRPRYCKICLLGPPMAFAVHIPCADVHRLPWQTGFIGAIKLQLPPLPEKLPRNRLKCQRNLELLFRSAIMLSNSGEQ
jgi:hypothetical protein